MLDVSPRALAVGRMLIIATLAVSVCSAAGAFPRGGAGSTMHLYVIDEYDSYSKVRIVRFPIDASGVVSGVPDAHRNNASRVAIGPGGDLYLVTGVTAGTIEVFAPGALEGRKPLRTLLIPKALWPVYAIAVDPSGYLYVAVLNINAIRKGEIRVYAPGVGGRSAPVRIFALPEIVTNLAADRQGHLYAGHTLYSTAVVTEFESPATTPTELRDFCYPLSGTGAETIFAVGAKGDPGGEVYSFSYGSTGPPRYVDGIGYQDDGNYNCENRGRRIGPRDPPLTGGSGLAVDGTHLFVSNAFNQTLRGPAIFELDVNFGIQRPLAVISGASSTLHVPFVAAVGP